MMSHQRHQSLQYPQLPHQQQQQFMQSARASPRLQELQEVDEEPEDKTPSKTPEPSRVVRHNASDSLQREIDEAEYHLEEQFRSQLEHDQDYSPHNEEEKSNAATQPPHARDPSVQFAPQVPRFEGAVDKNLVLHHPRPHSRGHSLSQKYFGEDQVRGSTGEGTFDRMKPIRDDEKVDEEIETNPSNLGTPVHTSFAEPAHQRTLSTASNPWADVDLTSGANRRPSHGSKPSFSKLNVAAPEFKFNPGNASTFQPGQFNFGSTTFQPAVFQASQPRDVPSVHSSQFSPPAGPSAAKINVNAPVFSPGSSEFNFSAAGPKFRPDAPAFTPIHSIAGSVTSPLLSSSEFGGSIFGNIDLNLPDIVKPIKKSKAIPIVRPASRHSNSGLGIPTVESDTLEDENGRIIDETRVKRFRGITGDDDDVPQFAEPTPEPDVPAKATEEEHVAPETTLSSTMVSESTDGKDTTSPSEMSPEQSGLNWTPFELKSDIEISNFNDARPFGEDTFKPKHKKTLSAAAKPFMPGTSFTGSEYEDEKENTPVPTHLEDHERRVITPVNGTADETEESPEIERSPVMPSAEPTPNFGLMQSRFPASPSPVRKGLSASRFAKTPSPPKGLSASKYAVSPAHSEGEEQSPLFSEEQEDLVSPVAAEDLDDTQETISQPASPPAIVVAADGDGREPTFEEIDAVMKHLNEHDPTMGVNKSIGSPQWHQPSPVRHVPLTTIANESPMHLHPQFRSDAPSPSPRHYHLPLNIHQLHHQHQPIVSTELEDPFVDPPQSAQISDDGLPASDWEAAFSDEEQVKLDTRAQFFDGRVDELVGSVLAARLGPLEKTMEGIQHALTYMSRRTPSSRRDRRSISAELQESDADDEDDEVPVPRRSASPRRDKKMEQIRVAVLDAFAVQQRPAQPLPPLPPTAAPESVSIESMASILKALEDMREQFSQSLHLDFRAEDLRNVVEDAVERRMPPTPAPPVVTEGQEELNDKFNELQSQLAVTEQRLRVEEAKNEVEIASRRAAEDRTADVERQLQMALTKIDVEIVNRSAYDTRVVDLEDRLKHVEDKTEDEVKSRRAAEDRLSEVQRLLRIASEEENRLREIVEEKEEKMKVMEASHGQSTMRLALLEATTETAQKTISDLQNRIDLAEVDSRDSRQEARHWRVEAERAVDLSRRQGDDLENTMDENKQLHKLVDTLGTQIHETERIRENWRAKFISLQEDMSNATHEITEENARRAKVEQAMLARQEVLDAKLLAEARTRERLETEIERLEGGERQGMKAVSEYRRLDALLSEMSTENHKLQQQAMRSQAEAEEARSQCAIEVKRTREALQNEVDNANNQVNVVREDLEDQVARLHGQLQELRLDADTVRSRYEMVMEEAQSSKKTAIDELKRKHQDELDDLKAVLERKIYNAEEDAHRTETNFMERLSISTSKSENLQDRVVMLEEKLEIAQEAARAAAQAAKAAGVTSPLPQPQPTFAAPPHGAAAITQPKSETASTAMQLPEKISPQALRQSIMVLQEQLQEREQKIDELEQINAKLDPEADTKIAKRDDEIVWLRELLAVRHSDLQDIITALGRDDYDRERVKDAAIRLNANLQMEEQERERAMNGGSAINLPNIAASIRDAATPRVAQAVGPLAAAWGNWRKGGNISSNVVASPSVRGKMASGSNATPQRDSPASQSSFLSGLLTPPASNMRQTPTSTQAQGQPTAFASTGLRFSAQDLANRPRASPKISQRQADKMPARSTPPQQLSREEPVTPPMMRTAAYDSDAHAEDFDDAGFFEDDD